MKVLDKAVKIIDSPFIKKKVINSLIDDLENLASRIQTASDNMDDKDSASLRRSAEDVKKIANHLKLYAKQK